MTSGTAYARTAEAAPPRADRIYQVVAASCAAVAGGIHAMVAPEHLELAWFVGGFFVGVAAGQLALAMLLVRNRIPGARTTMVAIWANLAVVGVYVASRTADLSFLPSESHGSEHLPVAGGVGNGIPILPGAHIEPVGLMDFVCLVLELMLVAVLVGLLPGRQRRATTTVMLALGVLGFVVRGSGLLT